MQIISTKQDLQAAVAACKAANQTIGLVPTMGALHNGHASLVERAVAENDITFVSVFVNPTQFNNKEDLAKYPRNLNRDAELLQSKGVDYVFAPTPEEMYTVEEMQTTFNFDFGGLDQVMEGKHRPGHFNGVVQIVSKLFQLVEPDKAYFGEKDFQQLAIIRRMVDIMGFHLQIVGCPIVRETSGLALSSRNERLSDTEKSTAINISHILFESRQLIHSQNVKQVESWVIEQINRIEGLTVEYYEIVDQTTLQPAMDFHNAIGCVTVYCGEVRLIDNIKY
ncbi:MAG: pantoate--beta-alanine ligase [Paludibacter sp.]|nr:pantoate--beta-alanine ligase [Bacteroidales bacterium]MCM1068432.1 pantoate--beta-alanine ligase [Prevotella sp.]MCM1353387.1 pantoate--beta-alanine ligase [Bacteroides sp.]MCM1442548.1 pantoate--beta-alanine ligase [Muribaculum sp.]MCM1481393.1 pantoate--beta-alanine ligase [Paludibacter sp.]